MMLIIAIGIATGCVYALVAVGYSLIYRTTAVVNFAQGSYVMVGGFSTWWFFSVARLPYPVAVLLGVLVGDRDRTAAVDAGGPAAVAPAQPVICRAARDHHLRRHRQHRCARRPGPDAADAAALDSRLRAQFPRQPYRRAIYRRRAHDRRDHGDLQRHPAIHHAWPRHARLRRQPRHERTPGHLARTRGRDRFRDHRHAGRPGRSHDHAGAVHLGRCGACLRRVRLRGGGAGRLRQPSGRAPRRVAAWASSMRSSADTSRQATRP